MTCIVGIKTKSGVMLGGDTQGVAGWDQRIRLDDKVFTLGDFARVAVGFTSSYRMGQILRFHLDLPALDLEEDEYRWAVTKFVPAARKALKDHGYVKVDSNVETSGKYLLAVRGRLFLVEPDQQVAELAAPFNACGSGEDYAIGALHVLQEARLSPREKLMRALDTAAAWNTGVGGPFTFVETRSS